MVELDGSCSDYCHPCFPLFLSGFLSGLERWKGGGTEVERREERGGEKERERGEGGKFLFSFVILSRWFFCVFTWAPSSDRLKQQESSCCLSAVCLSCSLSFFNPIIRAYPVIRCYSIYCQHCIGEADAPDLWSCSSGFIFLLLFLLCLRCCLNQQIAWSRLGNIQRALLSFESDFRFPFGQGNAISWWVDRDLFPF